MPELREKTKIKREKKILKRKQLVYVVVQFYTYSQLSLQRILKVVNCSL